MPDTVRKAEWVGCDRCAGTGKMPVEWDLLTGAVVARGPCHSCLGTGKVLANAVQHEEAALV